MRVKLFRCPYGIWQAAAKKAGFHFISALTKPQIEKLLQNQVLQLGLFEEKVSEVLSEEGQCCILRRNSVRQQEMAQTRQQKQQTLRQAAEKANGYLARHRRAKVETQRRHLAVELECLGLDGWLAIRVKGRRLRWKVDPKALAEESRLDG